MSKKEEHPVVDMLWLHNGTPDPFPEYPARLREDLPMADFSDDALGNYAFMYYDRDMNAEVAVMMNPGGEHRPKIAFMTAIKERVRWLSRRLAIAEGRYPGIDIPDEVVLKALNQERFAGRTHMLLSHALCVALGKPAPIHGDRNALLSCVWSHLKDLDLPEDMYNKAFGIQGGVGSRPTNSEVLRNLRELIKFVEEKTGIKVEVAPPGPVKITDAVGGSSHGVAGSQLKGVVVKVLDENERPTSHALPTPEVVIDQDSIDKRFEGGEVPEAARRFADAQWKAELRGLYLGLGINPEGTDVGAIVALIQDAADVSEEGAMIAIGQNPDVTGLERIEVFYDVCKKLKAAGVKIPYTGQGFAADVVSDIFERPAVALGEVKRAYDPKDFSKHPSHVGWSTKGGNTQPPEGFDITLPTLEPGDTYLGSYTTTENNGYIVHGLVDKHGLKVTYLCSKAGTLIQILRWTEGLNREHFEFKNVAAPANPGLALYSDEEERVAGERWSTEIHGLYAVFGGRTHEMSREAIMEKIFAVCDMDPRFNSDLVFSALGFNQELNMIERLSLFHVLLSHLIRADYYVPVNGDTILTPDDSGYSVIVKSRVYLSGLPILVRPGVHLNLVKQITK